MDNILERFGLKYEDLSQEEKRTLHQWADALSKNAITVESIRSYISTMKEGVEQELTKTDHNTKQDIFLKARLRNYMLLQSFLDSPDRAKKAIEQTLTGIKLDRK